MVMQRILRRKSIHKLTLLEKIIEMFPDKNYFLIGDNTQHDISIYLQIATKYPKNIRYIIIREVFKSQRDRLVLQSAQKMLELYKIGVHYDSNFPDNLSFVM